MLILHTEGMPCNCCLRKLKNYRCYSTVKEPAKQRIFFVPTYFASKDEAFKNIVLIIVPWVFG